MLEELHQGSPSGELNWRRKQALVSPGEGEWRSKRDTGQFFPPLTCYPTHGKKLAQRGDCRISRRCSVSPSPQLYRCLPERRRAPTHRRRQHSVWSEPSPPWGTAHLGLVRQGDGIHYPVGQPLLGDSLPFLLTSVIDKELLRASEAPGVVHVYAQYTARAAVSLQALDGRRGQFLQVAAFCRHKCTATALSTWGMSTYPLAAPPSRVARMEEADEPLLAVKRGRPQLHQLLVHFREERNQGRAWSRAMARAEEPIISPRGLGTRMCARLQPRSRGSPGKHGRQLWVQFGGGRDTRGVQLR